MLAIYTVVFSVAFKARWGGGEEGRVAFAIILFSGMIVHGFFAECLNRAPSLIISHPSYVKKVAFPLEVLPWVALCSALLHFCVGFAVLLVFCFCSGTAIQVGAILAPVILLPLISCALGLTWILASLGVYLRDLAQSMGLVTTILLFLSPVFYPTDALPETYQAFIKLNPLTLPIIQLRELVLWGKPVDWQAWAINLLFGIAIAWAGYWWFQKTRRGFADVL